MPPWRNVDATALRSVVHVGVQVQVLPGAPFFFESAKHTCTWYDLIMSDEEVTEQSSSSDAIPSFDQDTPGDEIISRLKDLEEGDAEFEAARTEFMRRARNFPIDDVCIDLFVNEPFYGSISARVNKVPTQRLPTAAVTVLNDVFVMLWNKAFFTRIAPDYHKTGRERQKAAGVMMHEFLHLILEHVLTRSEGMKYPMLANWAFDLAINCMIPREKLPDGLLIPGEPLTIPDDAEGVYRPEELEQYKKMSAFIEGLPKERASEWYYTQLIEHIKKNSPEMLQDPDWGKPMDQKGQGQGQGQGQGSGQGDGIPDSVKKGFGRLGNFDSHDDWDKVSDQEKEFIRQRMKNMLRDAVNQADNRSNGWGSVPGELQKLLRKLISDQVDWRAVLRQFIGYSQHLNKSSTIKRLNRRYPYVHPGSRRSRGACLWIYIDQSGSVGDEDIAILFGELDNLAKKVSFRVYFFDTEVDEDFIDWRRGQKHPAQRHRMGGTDFGAPTRHANKHKGENDGVLILTDGECEKPEPCLSKRAWIIVPDRQLLFETDELVIHMTRDKSGKAEVKG